MGVFRRRIYAEFYINNPQQCRAMGTAIDRGGSGSSFMLLFESSAFQRGSVIKAYYFQQQLVCSQQMHEQRCHLK